ncbi:Ulp1 protease family protein [Nitzschia inconspicua]|uniref:Ulp1 protease family protein n=1 Tax=Nitzschia inconspicua TaxID=303405 RepID=A0A9K3PW06_9STRA|nr:Ulp1 protease family protein [Nitzschia inconspicua]
MAPSTTRNSVGREVADDLLAANDETDFSNNDTPKRNPSFPHSTSDLQQISSLDPERQRQPSRAESTNRLAAKEQPPPAKISRWKGHSFPAASTRSRSRNGLCIGATADDAIDLCESGEDTDMKKETKDRRCGKKRTSPQTAKGDAKSSESQLPLVRSSAPKKSTAKRAKFCENATAKIPAARGSETNKKKLRTTKSTLIGTVDLSMDDEKPTALERAQVNTLGNVPGMTAGRTNFLPANDSQGLELTVPKLTECDTRPQEPTAMSRNVDTLMGDGNEMSSSVKPCRDKTKEPKEIMEVVQEMPSGRSMYDRSSRSKCSTVAKKMRSELEERRLQDDSDDWRTEDDTHRLTRASARRNKPSQGDKKKLPETIEILTSDDDGDDPNGTKFDVVRFLVDGQFESDNNCNLVFDAESKEIRLSYKSGRKVKSHVISLHDIMDCCYHLSSIAHHDDDDRGNNEEIYALEREMYAILSLTVNSRVFRQQVKNPRKDIESEVKRMLIQFEEREEFEDLLRSMTDAGLSLKAVGQDAVDLPSLAKEAEKLRSSKSSVSRMRKKNPFSSGKANDEILLVYPFAEESSKIEAVVPDFDFFSTKRDSKVLSDSAQTDFSVNPIEFSKPSHCITVRVEDYARLEPKVWLNDTLIDFFMLWISRDTSNNPASDALFFTSHFYSNLARKGIKGVESWTAKKNIDIFKKKLIFIPINKTNHWSLCVIINPGEITNFYAKKEPTSKMPCLICLDSLKMHCPRGTKQNIMSWLNSEWSRLRSVTEGKGPFNDQSLQLFTPKVPLQKNRSDCGIFVCRYSLGLYNLRHLGFTQQDIFARGNEAFLDMITRGDEFKFNVQDIQSMRREFQTLIEHLSKLFSQWQKKTETVD